jgi:hypothetical protein
MLVELIHAQFWVPVAVRTARFGKGLFALEPIGAGERILTFRGELMNEVDIDARIAAQREGYDDPLQVGHDLFMDICDESYFVNHSCDPNAGLRGMADLVAMRAIAKGEEITFDYSTTVGANVVWSMQCHCGVAECRGSIGNVTTVPPGRLVRYRQANALQDFIVEQMFGERAAGSTPREPFSSNEP